MKHIVAIILTCFTLGAFAQEKTEKPKKFDWSKTDFSKRASDHFMFQIGYAGLGNKAGLNTRGLSKTFNAYFLLDFRFKTNPKFSVAIGPGIGTDNIYFTKTAIDVSNRSGATFKNDTITRYKKSKLATGYLELPLELRYSTKPTNMNSGWKFALGVKIGTLLDGKVKSKIDLDATGKGGYIAKTKDKRNFNGTRLAATARVGYGNISLFGSYTLTDFFKAGFGPDIKPFSIGLAISGL
jgi:hypothetical protein